MSAIEAVSRNVKTLADGTLRLSIDISPVYAKDAFTMFGMPDVPLAIVRLTQEAAMQSAQEETINADKPKGGALSQWLAIRCNEPKFWEFIEATQESKDWYGDIQNADDCDAVVKEVLVIQSKADLDNDKEAEARFHSMIRLPYAEWLMGRRG